MELRFILEHAEASIAAARKLFNTSDRDRCIEILEDLGNYITGRIKVGVIEPPNIDVKPAEPQ